MLQQVERVREEALKELEQVRDTAGLEAWRVRYLGRKSTLMQAFSRIKEVPPEERPTLGRRINEIRDELTQAYEAKKTALQQEELQRELAQRLDVTLPGRPFSPGRVHPTTRTIRRILQIFAEMGFQVFRSREVELDEYNFQLLNIPPYHPARDMQDTFYVDVDGDGDAYPVVLRTHTSPGQIHAMRFYASLNPEDPPPIRVVLPGMCFR